MEALISERVASGFSSPLKSDEGVLSEKDLAQIVTGLSFFDNLDKAAHIASSIQFPLSSIPLHLIVLQNNADVLSL